MRCLRLCTRFYSDGRLKLRPYQNECVDACLDAIEQRGLTRIGVSSPTGSGKTTMFLELAERIRPLQNGQSCVLILVNGITLARQAAERAQSMFPGKVIEIEQGSQHGSGHADITVGTVQTLRQPARLAKYNAHAFKCVVVDEAHHSTSPSYLSVLSHFNKDIVPHRNNEPSTNAVTPIIGFSATFTRHDGIALGQVYQEIVFHKDFMDLMNEKW